MKPITPRRTRSRLAAAATVAALAVAAIDTVTVGQVLCEIVDPE